MAVKWAAQLRLAECCAAWLTEMNNKLYFAADDGVKGRALWVSDPALNGLPRQRHRDRPTLLPQAVAQAPGLRE
jgi:hypothetical protein